MSSLVYINPVKTIALIGKYRSPEVSGPLLALAAYLKEKGIRVLIEGGTADTIEGAHGHSDGVADYPTIGKTADVAVVVGGDGTMLDAARQLAEFNVPLVGVNVGRVGFMTDLSREQMRAGIDQLLAGQLLIERRFLLLATVMRDGVEVGSGLALNDVVVNKGEIGRMIELELRVDGEFLYVLRADGMIVATPTGSTAYALSANGPILHPSVPGIAIVPLCPHALSNRPITIADHNVVEMTLLAAHVPRLHFEGRGMQGFRAVATVRVAHARHKLTRLNPPGYSCFAVLRVKPLRSSPPLCD